MGELLSAALVAVLGCLWVIFVMRRNLPVPKGRWRFVRFNFWFSMSLVVSVGVYFVVIFSGYQFVLGLPSEMPAPIALYLIQAPFWFGFGYGIYLQFIRKTPERSAPTLGPGASPGEMSQVPGTGGLKTHPTEVSNETSD